MRFAPPALTLTPVHRWVLQRAFADPGAPLPTLSPGQRAEAVDLARELLVSSRIAARIDFERLRDELGEAGARRLFLDHASAAATDERIDRATGAVARRAAGLGVPIVLLKHAALRAAGRLALGSRDAADLDLLAPLAQAEVLHRELVGAGFAPVEERTTERHLPSVVHPRLGAVEIHLRLLGLRLGGGREARRAPSADWAELDAAGLLEPLTSLPGRCARPAAEATAAYALVHAIAQHGHRPSSYPLGRLFGDLIDLGADGWSAPAIDRLHGWIAADVDRDETEAAVTLCRHLRAGTLPDAPKQGAATPATSLLHHALAAATDPSYAASLEVLGLRRPLTDRPRAVHLLRRVRSALLPTRRQLDLAFGPPSGPLDALGQRLRQPIRLLGALGRPSRAPRREPEDSS